MGADIIVEDTTTIQDTIDIIAPIGQDTIMGTTLTTDTDSPTLIVMETPTDIAITKAYK